MAPKHPASLLSLRSTPRSGLALGVLGEWRFVPIADSCSAAKKSWRHCTSAVSVKSVLALRNYEHAATSCLDLPRRPWRTVELITFACLVIDQLSVHEPQADIAKTTVAKDLVGLVDS